MPQQSEANMPTIEMTDREITLVRVALMVRMGRIKNRSDMADSYNESRAICQKLWTAREQLHGCKDARELTR